MVKIISFQHKEQDIDVNDVLRQYKYAIPEHQPIWLSNGSWLHTYKVTDYSRDSYVYGDQDEEQECFEREVNG